jgi:hypothetical protein
MTIFTTSIDTRVALLLAVRVNRQSTESHHSEPR